MKAHQSARGEAGSPKHRTNQMCEGARAHIHKHELSPAYTAARAGRSGSLSFSELSEGLYALKNNNGPAFTRLHIDEVCAVSHPVLRKAAHFVGAHSHEERRITCPPTASHGDSRDLAETHGQRHLATLRNRGHRRHVTSVRCSLKRAGAHTSDHPRGPAVHRKPVSGKASIVCPTPSRERETARWTVLIQHPVCLDSARLGIAETRIRCQHCAAHSSAPPMRGVRHRPARATSC
jgi:hypothetical protein